MCGRCVSQMASDTPLFQGELKFDVYCANPTCSEYEKRYVYEAPEVELKVKVAPISTEEICPICKDAIKTPESRFEWWDAKGKTVPVHASRYEYSTGKR